MSTYSHCRDEGVYGGGGMKISPVQASPPLLRRAKPHQIGPHLLLQLLS